VLTQVADGVWVRQSAWVWSNAIAVHGEGGLILTDPGIAGSDLNQLADDLDRLDIPVVAGFCTHPHWDHLLWHPRLGDVPRYAPPTAPTLPVKPESGRRRWRRRAHRASLSSSSRSSPRCPRTAVPCRARSSSIRRPPSATPRSSLADRGVLLAGDMLSDVLIPLLDPRQTD
jgi:glyoxylase-like metal-dependent hydrolase (beta-lactamase superfamily II)